MTNDKGAKFIKLLILKYADKADEIIRVWLKGNPWRGNEANHVIQTYLAQAHDAGRAEAIAEVVPVLEFYSEPTNWTNADDKSYKFTQVGESDWNKSVAHGFVGGKRARELLQKLKGET